MANTILWLASTNFFYLEKRGIQRAGMLSCAYRGKTKILFENDNLSLNGPLIQHCYSRTTHPSVCQSVYLLGTAPL